MKINVDLWSHLTEVFLQFEIFRSKFVEKIKHKIYGQFFFLKS